MLKSWIDAWFDSHVDSMFVKKEGKTLLRTGWLCGEQDVSAHSVAREKIRMQLKQMFWMGSIYGLLWGIVGPGLIQAMFPEWVVMNHAFAVWASLMLLGLGAFLHFNMQDIREKIRNLG